MGNLGIQDKQESICSSAKSWLRKVTELLGSRRPQVTGVRTSAVDASVTAGQCQTT